MGARREEREGGGVYGCLHVVYGMCSGNSRYLENAWDSEENPMCRLAALLCQSNAKQL